MSDIVKVTFSRAGNAMRMLSNRPRQQSVIDIIASQIFAIALHNTYFAAVFWTTTTLNTQGTI